MYENNLGNIKRIKEIERYLPDIRNLNNNFIQFILEKDLKSKGFITSIKNLEGNEEERKNQTQEEISKQQS